jgi:hypothetical protein
MTLVLAALGEESIWLLADRRLSRAGKALRDDARKITQLETSDGVGLCGYAGLGATTHGTEPADWVSAVLRGCRLTMEHALGTISAAMRTEFPRHIRGLPGHHFIVPTFIGDEARLYSIELAAAAGHNFRWRYTRWASRWLSPTRPLSPRIGLGGTGRDYLSKQPTDRGDWKDWTRHLLRLVKAHDKQKISARAVADHLATISHRVHREIADNSVGPSCIVSWRYRKGGVYKGGGGHQFYTETTRAPDNSSIPVNATGMDVAALTRIIVPHMMKQLEAMRAGTPFEIDQEAINRELAQLPSKPDKRLR